MIYDESVCIGYADLAGTCNPPNEDATKGLKYYDMKHRAPKKKKKAAKKRRR